MTNIDPELRCGPWTWRAASPRSPGRGGLVDVQLLHAALSLPVLDFVDGAFVLQMPAFAADGTELRCEVVAVANRAGFVVTIELATGRWRSAGEPRGQPAAVLQQRFGAWAATAPWPVVVVAQPAAARAPEVAAEPVVAPAPAELPPPPIAPVAPQIVEVAPQIVEVAPPAVVTPDGRWQFQFELAPVQERDAGGKMCSYCYYVLRDARGAVVVDSRSLGELCWPSGRWLRLVRASGATTWFMVDVERAVFWLENFREPLGPERPLHELGAALAGR